MGLVYLLPLCALISLAKSVSHETTLLWTEKHTLGTVRIVGLPGDPENWIYTGQPSVVGQAMPADNWAKVYSSRIALGYLYETQNLFWSDRGFKEIMRSTVQPVTDVPYLYNSTVYAVYYGISSEVNGIAVDWVSKSIYWTDALYNWITVAAATKTDTYRHIVTTDLDKPQGIVVHPRKGLMFWSDWGAVPKIEQADLSGENRMVLIRTGIDHPLGMAIDYKTDTLYWVDNFHDIIERYDINDAHRTSINVVSVSLNSHSDLFGITVYKDFLFLTDQLHRQLRVYNKTSGRNINNIQLGWVPYDIMMYDDGIQEDITNECMYLDCEHICISEANGRGHCMCSHGYVLTSDLQNCEEEDKIHKPMYLYAIGHSLCGTRISIADSGMPRLGEDIYCFKENISHARAMAFHVYDEILFFSDTDENIISRVKLVGDYETDVITVQTGQVKGMVVDWLSENLYWTDEEFGHIMVSRLDGRYPKIIRENVGKPRGISVHPVMGSMYWADAHDVSLYQGNMDGTNVSLFIHDMTIPDGVTVDPHEDRLYWAEEIGVKTMQLDQTDKRTLVSDERYTFQDVTVFQDYFAWTDGEAAVRFGVKSTGTMRGLEHTDTTVSHDVIAYSDYLQPLVEGQCDNFNGGCDQLCLPTPSGRTCACAIGYYLDSDLYSCNSDITTGRFLLFVDPYHKQVYQLDLKKDNPSVQGIPLPTAEYPTRVDLDPVTRQLYWIDMGAKVLKRANLKGGDEEIVMVVPDADMTLEAFGISGSTRRIYYYDPSDKEIYHSNLDGEDPEEFASANSLVTLVVDDNSGYVYWVDNSTDYKIKRKPMRGSGNTEVVVDTSKMITTLRLDETDGKMYWSTDEKIYQTDKDGGNQDSIYSDSRGQISSMATSKDYVYFSHFNKKAVYRIRKKGSDNAESVTSSIFARITDIKIYWSLEALPGDTDSSTSKLDVKVMIGVVVGVLVLLLLVLVIALFLWRGCGRRKPKKSDYETPAHDNPTYMTTAGQMMTITQEELNDPPYHTLPPLRPPSMGGESRDSELPDVVKLPLPDDEKFDLPDDDIAPVHGADGGVEGSVRGSVVEGITPSDKDRLVKRRPSQAEVVLTVGDLQTKPNAKSIRARYAVLP